MFNNIMVLRRVKSAKPRTEQIYDTPKRSTLLKT